MRVGRASYRGGPLNSGNHVFHNDPRELYCRSVAWICALPLEAAAAKAILDKIHPQLSQLPSDDNAYTLGEISGHNIVIVCLPLGMYGTIAAATVAAVAQYWYQGYKTVPEAETRSDIRDGLTAIVPTTSPHRHGRAIYG